MSERTPGGEAGGGDDLRSLITDAIARGNDDDNAAASDDAGSERRAGGEDAGRSARETPQRDESGRFVPGGAQTPPKPAAEPAERGKPRAEGDAPAEREEASGAAAESEKPLSRSVPEQKAPEHWSAVDKAKFAALPEAARAPFMELYSRMEAGFTPKLQRGAQLEKDYGALDQSVFTPQIRQLIQNNGIESPRHLVERWAQTEAAIVNPETRNQAFARLIHNYQGDPGQITELLNQLRGFAPHVGRDGGGGQPPPAVDPILAQRLEALEQENQSRAQRDFQAARAAANARVVAFANEADAQGNLKHPYFAQLEERMAALLKAERDLGHEPSLEDLYQAAIYSDDSTREQVLASQRDAEAARAAEERRAKAARAQRASVSVNGSAGPGRAALANGAEDMSLRDTIRRNLSGGQTSGGPGRI